MADLAPANENEYRCPICDVPMQPDDICAADVNLGICHAHCLDGVPVVSLDTGELVDGPISTFRFREEEGQDPVARFINAQTPTDPDIAAATANRPDLYLCVPDEAAEVGHRCPLCDVPMQLGDPFITHERLGNCHAECVKRAAAEIERARENDARRIEELERELVDLQKQLSDISQIEDDHCVLVKGWWRIREVVVCPEHQVQNYLARGFRWDWRETAVERGLLLKVLRHFLKEKTRRVDEANAQLREELAIARKDSERLDLLRDNSWDLRCFEIPTGGGDADVGWRVIGHWQAKPNERTVGEAFQDDPRAAIDDAARWLQEGKPA